MLSQKSHSLPLAGPKLGRSRQHSDTSVHSVSPSQPSRSQFVVQGQSPQDRGSPTIASNLTSPLPSFRTIDADSQSDAISVLNPFSREANTPTGSDSYATLTVSIPAPTFVGAASASKFSSPIGASSVKSSASSNAGYVPVVGSVVSASPKGKNLCDVGRANTGSSVSATATMTGSRLLKHNSKASHVWSD